jgi:hypothetical protein
VPLCVPLCLFACLSVCLPARKACLKSQPAGYRDFYPLVCLGLSTYPPLRLIKFYLYPCHPSLHLSPLPASICVFSFLYPYPSVSRCVSLSLVSMNFAFFQSSLCSIYLCLSVSILSLSVFCVCICLRGYLAQAHRPPTVQSRCTLQSHGPWRQGQTQCSKLPVGCASPVWFFPKTGSCVS